MSLYYQLGLPACFNILPAIICLYICPLSYSCLNSIIRHRKCRFWSTQGGIVIYEAKTSATPLVATAMEAAASINFTGQFFRKGYFFHEWKHLWHRRFVAAMRACLIKTRTLPCTCPSRHERHEENFLWQSLRPRHRTDVAYETRDRHVNTELCPAFLHTARPVKYTPLSGNALASINVVALHQTRLVLGWVTVCGRVNHFGM